MSPHDMSDLSGRCKRCGATMLSDGTLGLWFDGPIGDGSRVAGFRQAPEDCDEALVTEVMGS